MTIEQVPTELATLVKRKRNIQRVVEEHREAIAFFLHAYSGSVADDDRAMSDDEHTHFAALHASAATLQLQGSLILLAAIERQIAELMERAA